ncbi:LppU/SCO3897 family protein [Micromonospora sp. LOL_023]|uniref:LppU/SCO3897 family protein n=1 Tax=Micromonospora sp. LOL_023 TaxID=3345418 RepID=UPI003A84BEC0
MTSEGTQHPGQEPAEAGVGGPAPYDSQRQSVDQPSADSDAAPTPQQWSPPGGGGWGTSFGEQAGRTTGYPAPSPYPAPAGAASGQPGGIAPGPPAEHRPGGPGDEPSGPRPAEAGWAAPPAIPPAAPWSPQQAWRTDQDRPATSPASDQPEPQRFPSGPTENRFEPPADDAPSRHGAALPFAPAGPTPLPPQEARVPGASLAAALGGQPAAQPAAHVPQQRSPYDEQPVAEERSAFPGPSRQPMAPAGTEPSPASPTSGGPAGGAPANGAATGRTVTASAAVPSASKVAPPADQSALGTGRPPAQPRVYGRPAGSEPEPGGRPEPFGPGGAPFPPTGSPVPSPEPGFGPPPLAQRPPGQSLQAFGARPNPEGSPAGGAARADIANLALPHLSQAAHIQPTSAADAARGYPPPGAAPYGDLLGDPHRDTRQAVPGAYQSPEAGHHQPGGYGPVGQSIAAAPRPGELPPASAAQVPGQGGAPDQEQNRFDAFRPEPATPAGEEAKSEPEPQVRNGRVLVAVLAAAALLVAIPLSLVWLITRPGDQAFDPAVGTCVKQSGNTAAPADCAEPGAYQVVTKVGQVDQCADPNAPHIEIPAGSGSEQVLCLQPAAAGDPAGDDPAPDSDATPTG